MALPRDTTIDNHPGFGPFTRYLAHLAYGLYSKVKKIDGPYEALTPNATYAPWRAEPDFLNLYGIIKSHTLVNILQCYGLWSLVRQSAKSSGALLEVGVWRGGTGGLIARAAEKFGITDPVYLCDTFSGVVKAGPADTHYSGGEHKDTSMDIVRNLVYETLRAERVRILQGIFPDETAHLITETKFRFCHIDVDVYDSAREIMQWIWGKMAVGGIVVFDDYGFRDTVGITRFVDEQMANPDNIYIYNLSGHGILIKIR